MHSHGHLLRTRGGQHALAQLGVCAPHPFLGRDDRQTLRHGIDQLGIHMLLEHQRLNHGAAAQIAALRASSATFSEAATRGFSRLFDFSGRSSRSEFWWFYLFVVIVQIVVQGLVAVIIGTDSGIYTLLVFILAIALAIPLYAAGSRRMHDTGKSGWLQLLVLIPCVGIIIMIVLWAQAGSDVDNQYGAPPA